MSVLDLFPRPAHFFFVSFPTWKRKGILECFRTKTCKLVCRMPIHTQRRRRNRSPGDICVCLLQLSLCTSVEYVHGQWSPLHYFIRPALFVCLRAHFCFVLNARFTYTAVHFLVWYGCFHTSSRPYSGCARLTFLSSPRAQSSCVHALIESTAFRVQVCSGLGTLVWKCPLKQPWAANEFLAFIYLFILCY